jgi:hypothetical protein
VFSVSLIPGRAFKYARCFFYASSVPQRGIPAHTRFVSGGRIKTIFMVTFFFKS